ncbi:MULTISPECIES: fumarylacetoacetate hydrolase family protein [unclassified Diaminobutyricimonas]|uniref:fumarylacetoacetate hydrolase family protein n=1 Tax=unclassified Diaminobutyricimonas TaxID=2643261 RepID=UPI0012F4FE18|nr:MULTISPECIES: fumarylacetoacetate hydrolase family protein [unclassified Diaminobutyricimonas]
MHLVGFTSNGSGRHIGRLVGEVIEDLGAADSFYEDPFLNSKSSAIREFRADEVKFAPAVPITSRVFCVGINYVSHAGESKDLAGIDLPKVPMVFGRWEQTLITDGESAPVPHGEEGLDWEVELAAVVGRRFKHGATIRPEDAVFGYAAFNDLSARRKQLETPQFTLGKNADRSGPISAVVTAEEVGDISAGLRVRTLVNGVVKQDGNTRDLIHDIPTIIAHVSETLTLLPGDIIATGTPGGVGAGMKPPQFLKAGDVVEIEVERVGKVRTPIG